MGRKSMNGKKRSRLWAVSAILLITIAIYSCGKSKSAYSETGAGAPAAATEEIAYDTGASYDAGAALKKSAAYAEEAYEYEIADEAAAAETYVQEDSGQGTVAAQDTSRKLIKTVNISAETEEFDTLVPGLQRQVETLGGYIESISVYDVNSYYVGDQMVKQRCADLTARVPKEKLDGFLSQVGEQTNVTSRSESVEDVTLQYVDLESHKKALLTEQERLLALLGQAESVEDIIAIEGRLSEVRYQLESMESQLRTYDNQIDYSTVHLYIEEVRKYSPPQTATVWQRIGNGFMKSLEDIGFGIRDMGIYFVIDLPYIILGLLAAVVIFFVLRALIRRLLRSSYVSRLREMPRGSLTELLQEAGRKKGREKASAQEPGESEAETEAGQGAGRERTKRETEAEPKVQGTDKRQNTDK